MEESTGGSVEGRPEKSPGINQLLWALLLQRATKEIARHVSNHIALLRNTNCDIIYVDVHKTLQKNRR